MSKFNIIVRRKSSAKGQNSQRPNVRVFTGVSWPV